MNVLSTVLTFTLVDVVNPLQRSFSVAVVQQSAIPDDKCLGFLFLSPSLRD